ncbi:MAG: FUSC family protein [Bacteroidetes bacterium]|nr:FUSC family protein [Bacteroidota bacterium]
MRFQPIKKINSIVRQEYFEPTISWAFRVVLALNVPLIIIPIYKGFSFEVIWAAFGAYMLALIDYRGPHYKKIIIQSVEAGLMFFAALLGMGVSSSITLSILMMFLIGMFAALIRNWSDYGSNIGVAVGFFFLFGLAYPLPFDKAIDCGIYLLIGAAWSILITVASFPFKPSSPVRRSVAKIWQANTDLLDTIILHQSSETKNDHSKITEKEMAVRKVINHSIDLFSRRKKTRLKAQHYDMMMELRRTSALFGASLNVMYEELEVLNGPAFKDVKDSVLYKTLSAYGQASARMAIVIFTFRADDLTLAKVRVKRCEVAIELFKEASKDLQLSEKEKSVLQHFIETLYKAYGYLQQSILQIEEKLNFKKSDYLENYKLSINNFLAGLKPRAVVELIKELTHVNSEQFKYALRVAFVLSIGVFVFKFFNIDHGQWIPLTIIIVIQPYYGATRKKGIERVVGTVLGIIVGGIIMLLPVPHQAFVILLIFVSFFVAYFLRNNYKVGVFFVTIMMVILMQLSQQSSMQLIGWRVLSTLIGSVLALLAGYIFWPMWEKERFPTLLSNALLQNKTYLVQTLKYFNKESKYNWYKYRNSAEAANNSLFACVQRMFEEPESVRESVDLNFAIVGVNIRIAREITSVAMAMEQNNLVQTVTEINNFVKEIDLLFDWLAANALIKENAPTLPDFNVVKETLRSTVFDENKELQFVKVELEKIIFELEVLCLMVERSPAKPVIA